MARTIFATGVDCGKAGRVARDQARGPIKVVIMVAAPDGWEAAVWQVAIKQ